MKHPILVAVTTTLFLTGSALGGDDTTKPAPAAPGAPAAPAAGTKHENKITPEAKAAFEKMEKITNSPVRQGLKEASGTIEADMMGMASSMKFTFKAPEEIHVTPDDSMQGPMAMAGKQMAKGSERTLRMMFGVYRPADDDEFDAAMVTKDGKELLEITTYKDGVEEGKNDFTLDANGLIASTSFSAQHEKGEVENNVTFTWTKVGDLYRLEKFEAEMSGGQGGGGGRGGRGMGGGGGGGGMNGGKITITLTYSDVGKFAIATSWKTELGGMNMSYESRISELTVDGKKVDIKKPEGGKKDETGTGEGGEEGGEKEGK